MPYGTGPCAWTIPDPTCCPRWESATPEERERAKRFAAWLLWVATGRQLGQCETRLRPCRRHCASDAGWPVRPDGRLVAIGRWVATVVDPAAGSWGGVRCGCPPHSCSCTRVCEIDLPGFLPEPVRVVIDGQEVPLSSFRVDNGRWLVWQRSCTLPGPEGPCDVDCFPACQDLSLPPDCPGTWEITYRHGYPVPAEGLLAASELACEVLKACGGAGPGECRLPSNVIALTRNGVSMEFANNGSVTAAAIGNGRTLRFGIPAVDLFVAALNPYGITAPAVAWSPDLPSAGRVTTWP